MTLSQKQRLFAVDVAKLILWVSERPGWGVTFGEAYRPLEMARIYATAGKGIVDSLHTQRLAIDLNLFIDGDYKEDTESHRPLGEYWESLSPENRWGGRFKRPDGNHYERTI